MAAGRRAPLAIVVALCVWWNLALIALFGTGLMDRKQLELGQNAYDAFVTIPRMAPQLAYRYLVDRDSYYRSRAPGADPLTQPCASSTSPTSAFRSSAPTGSSRWRRATRSRAAGTTCTWSCARTPRSRRATRTCSTACRDSIG